MIAACAVLRCAGVCEGGTWITSGAGTWSDPVNWTDNTVPPAGDSALVRAHPLVNGGPNPVNVAFDAFYAAPLTDVSVLATGGNFGTSSVTFVQNSPATQLNAATLTAGGNRGSLNWTHSAGTLLVQNHFQMGGAGNGFGNQFNSNFALSGSGVVSVGSMTLGTFFPPVDVNVFAQSGGALQTNSLFIQTNGSYVLSGGAATVNGALVAFGSLSISAGSLSVTGDYEGQKFSMVGGEMIVDGNYVHAGTATGTMTGGTIDVGGAFRSNGGSFRQTGGMISAGGFQNPADFKFLSGSLSVGTFLNTGSFTIGSNALLNEDIVTVSGAATLSGTLRVEVESSFAAKWLHAFTAMTYASRSGEFADYEFIGTPANFGFAPIYQPNALTLIFAREGDADLDGQVNLADFNILAANFGIAGAKDWRRGDFNLDGQINLIDFNRLAANFGLSAGPDGVVDPEDWSALASVIPEPSTVCAMLASAGMILRRVRRKTIQ